MKIIEDLGEVHDALKARKDLRVIESDDGQFQLRKAGSGFGTKARTKTPLEMPDAAVLRQLAELRGFSWQEGFENRVIPYWGSDERKDSDGDILRQSWSFDTFEKNPVMPFSHGWDLPPVGGILNWDVRQRVESDYQGPALALWSLFATPEMSSFAGEIFELANAGFLSAGSVGFQPLVITLPESDEERQQMGLGPYGYEFTKSELLEYSPCTIPANPGAGIARAMKDGKSLITRSALTVYRELARQDLYGKNNDKNRWITLEAQVVSLFRSVFPDLSLHKELDVPVVYDVPDPRDDEIRKLREDLAELRAEVAELREDTTPETVSPGILRSLEQLINKVNS